MRLSLIIEFNPNKQTYYVPFVLFNKECKEAGPVWFVFPGMGQQWPGMGRQMLHLPVFRASFEKCHKAVIGEGFDLLDMIERGGDRVYDNPLNAFVAITSIQVLFHVRFG